MLTRVSPRTQRLPSLTRWIFSQCSGCGGQQGVRSAYGCQRTGRVPFHREDGYWHCYTKKNLLYYKLQIWLASNR